ncbi:MAG: chemotaxis protein CheA [Opitutae bacterium]|nr:chemotaxis protein CheA [Opitutae bacterium]
MSISPESFPALSDAVNRLAAESILAQAGRDDGLIPAYSLLGQIGELCAGEPVLSGPVKAVHTALDQLLDLAQPFDDAAITRLRRLIDWLPAACGALQAGRAMPELGAGPTAQAAGAAPAAAPAPAAPPSIDALLTLNLAENRELLAEFHAEAVEHLQQIEAALLALEQHPADDEALNSIFRSFHTIKGNAGFLQLMPMHKLAHEVESLLDLARSKKLVLNPAIITEILRSRDALQAQVAQVGLALEQGRLPDQIIPVSHLISAVRRLASGAPAATACVAPPVPAAAPADEPITPANAAAPAPAAPAPGKAAGPGATVRVSTEKLDSLMDVVGELVIVQSQLIETARQSGSQDSALLRNVGQLTRITKELQHTAMALRMIPIKPTFQKMERLVRDLARDFGKKVNFTTSGEDTELDRTVVEEIGDPLVHMVRNSMDHGLELPADRRARGKAETGAVHLHAYHEGGCIVIELRDDGRGIDPDRICKKAVEKGLIAPDATLSRDEILALIFAPGFSTAEKVTAVSGRGVGMDVVKRNIQKLRGKVEISSEVGRGSIFKIKLPLTMAIIDGLVVRVGADRFILPSTSVQVALRPARDSLTTVQGRGELVEVRGRLLPLHRLHRRFGVPADSENPWEGIIVVVENNGRQSALFVDEMISKQEVVIKSLGAFMQGLPGVSGAAILGDGNIALILDPNSLLHAA